MPKAKRQVHVRLSDDEAKLFDRLLPHVSAQCGADLSASQLFAMALKALAQKYEPIPELDGKRRDKP